MANLTYGALSGSSADGSVILNPLGTDLIATSADGVEHAFAPGDIAWVLSAGALIMFMIPGLGYLYSGLARRKNALSLLFICMMALAICSFQWFFIGYSFVFSETGGVFWGDGLNVGFRNVMDRAMPESNGKLPELVFAFYQMTFACLVPAVMMGCIAERSRILPAMIFIFFWTTLVYDPLAHWIWSVNGWANKWGVLDYAGGVPVEIASGIGGLAYSYFIGKRRDYGTERILFKPQNVSQVVLGTVFLWVGWLGFNGGSCFSATLKAALAIFNTNLAGSVGAVVWLIMDFRLERKWSVVGFCTGAIAGLVAITPAAGFVSVPAAALIGLVSAVVSNLCTGLKHKMRCDDVMDIFAVHALAGIVGVIMTGFFAQSEYAATDAYAAIAGGWMNQNWIQMGKQVAWAAVGVTWTFVVTLAIMFVINLIPGCKFRASDEAQIVGMDEVELGEFAQDFVWLDRDLEGHYRTPHFKRHYQLSRSRTRNGRDASPRADVPMPAIHEHMASVDHDHYHPDSQGLGSSAGEKEKRGGAAGDRKDGASAMTGGSEVSQTASEVERSHVPGLRMGEPRAGATMALRDASPASWNEKA